MAELCNLSGKQGKWGSVILVHLLVLNSSNIWAAVEKTSKQNTINFPEAKFLSQFLCCTVAHSWRYTWILPSFPDGFLCDKAQINILCNTTLSVLGAWCIWGVSFLCSFTEGWSRSLLLRMGMAPLPSSLPSTSHALSSIFGGWTEGYHSLEVFPENPRRRALLPAWHGAIPLSQLSWVFGASEGRGLCSNCEAMARIWLPMGSINLSP